MTTNPSDDRLWQQVRGWDACVCNMLGGEGGELPNVRDVVSLFVLHSSPIMTRSAHDRSAHGLWLLADAEGLPLIKD